ncbi:MAG TPA: carboxypeptidase regulatory-like domain-containing protein, partial [Flavisolibacter sp.]|nr:carboxypeptidase regulatory-like domain-containing protein [Flavisolibacter sp.]
MMKNRFCPKMYVLWCVCSLLVILLSVCGNAAHAQDRYTIKGLVQDSMQNKPLSGATINLYTVSNLKNALFSATTTVDGKFVLTVKDTGTYWIEVSFSGYQPKQLALEVKGLAAPELLFDLVAAASTLKGVTVTAQQKLIEQTEDKIIYN